MVAHIILSIRHGLKGVNIHYLGSRLGKEVKEIRCQIFVTFCIMGAKLQRGIPIKLLLHLLLYHINRLELSALLSIGEVYNTVDEDHYKAT